MYVSSLNNIIYCITTDFFHFFSFNPWGSAIIWEVEHYPLENEKGHVLGKNMAILWEAEHHHLGSGTLSSEEEIKILW